MKKAIITTTINAPTEATLKFCKLRDWNFFIVGDLKTPHDQYHELEKQYSNIYYLTPEYQEKKYKELSDSIGWGCIQRRNIGFVEAYNFGADVIATIDDDNIPYDYWGDEVLIGQEIEVDVYHPKMEVFDPLSVTKENYLWHRGYPIQLLKERLKVEYKGREKRKVLVQADLWNGDPDIDAIARLGFAQPLVDYSDIIRPYCSTKIAPFNSQNTFLAREVMPYYAVLPHVGRLDDIWGAYILQHYFPNSVIYNKPTVYQARNEQDLIKNLEKEILGYRMNLKFATDISNFEKNLPEEAANFYRIYRKQYII